jgi:hypothetical protein
MSAPKHKFKVGQTVWWNSYDKFDCPPQSQSCAVVISIKFPHHGEPIYTVSCDWANRFVESKLRSKPL